MRSLCCFLLLFTAPIPCLSGAIKDIQTCKLNNEHEIKLISLQTLDGDTPYITFDNIIVSAFFNLDIVSGEIILSKCINNSLIFALDYGSPYIKGCLITKLKPRTKLEYEPEGFCFAERYIPESVWFGKSNTLVLIKNTEGVGEWQGRYIVYDSKTEEGHVYNELPDMRDYKVYYLNSNKK